MQESARGLRRCLAGTCDLDANRARARELGQTVTEAEARDLSAALTDRRDRPHCGQETSSLSSSWSFLKRQLYCRLAPSVASGDLKSNRFLVFCKCVYMTVYTV